MATQLKLAAEDVRQLTYGKRFLAADRAQLDVREISTWDKYLLREHRLLVPMNVQALYVQPGSAEPMVRLPMLVAGPTGKGVEDPEDGMPEPFAAGTPRPAGVHLHWAMPDALLRGTLATRADGAANRLALPVLPDRWVVLRILLARGSKNAVTTGWVLEADRAIAVPLGSWTEGGSKSAVPAGETIERGRLTGTVGGSISWSGVYDAVLNRFAFHDTLADVAALAPQGVDEDCAAYVVAGWWSDPALDPLDKARSSNSLDELLARLRWGLLYEWGDEKWTQEQDRAQFELRKALGLTTEERWSSKRPLDIPAPVKRTGVAAAAAAVAAAAPAYTPIDKTFVEVQMLTAASTFSADAGRRFVAPPWHLRSSLLHGAIYGVPVAGTAPVDRRPSAGTLRVAIGQHEDEMLAALSAAPQATPEQRRASERLLTAFTAQKINRLGSPDGLVELEEHEHAAAFTSVPGGIDGDDRYMQRVQTGGAGGMAVGKYRGQRATANVEAVKKGLGEGAPRAAQAVGGTTVYSSKSKPTLINASAARVNDIARSRVGEVLAPTESRIVKRPAARFAFPDEPMVAIRGASRSLRHGNDGRGSAAGTLTCRWPTHVIQEISGVIAKDRFVRSLGNGSVPSEALTLAREAVLHDPYHDDWIADAVAPSAAGRTGIFNRLKAESVLRFGVDGTYDGATAFLGSAAAPKTARAARAGAAAAAQRPIEPGVQQHQRMVADETRKLSLYKGADPDLVGVTTWAQPWIPMWLEWELQVEGIDPPTLEAWHLGAVDLETQGTAGQGAGTVLRGRALLTTGAAHTLHRAISDWLTAEDKLDAIHAGQVDEATEAAYQTLDAAVDKLDVVTAALDGMRTQLLGLAVTDGLRRPASGGGIANPAPIAPPHMLLAGALTLTRARLLDAFGRTLDVPVGQVAVPMRSALPARPNALAVAPRLMRPARWQFKLVDAKTEVGTVGVDARVDQIDTTLQVNPVAGFVMPDHLDESLELFSVDGSPIGELLHEPVSGGVMWEIAAGREGPADSGPLYGLAPAQQALGRFASGLVAADAAARARAPLAPDSGQETALSALLRAIDTTLWTVDSFAALGSEHVAGLVGRPIAVVRAQLKLELRPPDDIDLSDAQRAEEWVDAEREAARHAFPVRIGEVTRSDDGVLGFFVDDDYAHFRLVDKAIAGTAAEAGRSRGQLGLYASVTGMPPRTSITHPYIAGTDDADTLMLHIGQSVTLTIFMHPAGKAMLTSGVLPRKALQLARDWVGPGLATIAPSLRTGPVMVETDLDKEGQVRLPKVSVFGKDQNFLWRDTPATWRTDAILAATQTALLPDTPAELREGWIRVAPDAPKEGQP
ncbi:hypothetical protein [Variovorax paradoxus]|uniref:Uncharacterized protein n=1 Tax=Variovorax paradoxus TaxID=34073 RepID=A0A0H2M0K5_VARPD|nr:hypothetical protein [Variovorax paradoxus]KLN55949.1 hypothetical protein VPARA_29840 [Variovorax paradoxus]